MSVGILCHYKSLFPDITELVFCFYNCTNCRSRTNPRLRSSRQFRASLTLHCAICTWILKATTVYTEILQILHWQIHFYKCSSTGCLEALHSRVLMFDLVNHHAGYVKFHPLWTLLTSLPHSLNVYASARSLSAHVSNTRCTEWQLKKGYVNTCSPHIQTLTVLIYMNCLLFIDNAGTIFVRYEVV